VRECRVGVIERDFCQMRGKGKAVLNKKVHGAQAIIALTAVPMCCQPLERLSPTILLIFFDSCVIFAFSLLFFSPSSSCRTLRANGGVESVSMAVMVAMVVAMIIMITQTTTVTGFLLHK
jgi:hypothetical protein